MKTKTAAHLSLLIGLVSMSLTGTACGAAPTDAMSPSPSFTMTGSTPELDRADERVRQADAQLAVARKQLKAAQQLLKAAEADVRASKAERDALALKTQAQNLADEAGMTPSVAPPVGSEPKAIAVVAPRATTKVDTKAVSVPVTTTPAATAPMTGVTQSVPVDSAANVATPVTSTPVDASALKPIHNVDFNAEPLNVDETAAPAGAPVLR